MSRPEELAPPEIFYGETEAKKYAASSRMIEIQSEMAERALELLNLPAESSGLVLLDIGCGTGLSGAVLNEAGHRWVGVDISPSMLSVAVERGCEGDLMHLDIGLGLPFRPGSFDGAISVSAIQWLLNRDTKEHNPFARLKLFFRSLYACLKRGTRAVLQFYPSNEEQLRLIPQFATAAGFGGGLVVDFPHSKKARKCYLVLYCGPQPSHEPPTARNGMADGAEDGEDEDGVSRAGSRFGRKSLGGRSGATGVTARTSTSRHAKRKNPHGGPERVLSAREWVRLKNTQRSEAGLQARHNSKYTGRKRKAGW